MHVYQPSGYVPRSQRRKHKAKRGDDPSKARAFRRAALWSKQFIHQSANALAKPALAAQYEEWTAAAKAGALRRSSK